MRSRIDPDMERVARSIGVPEEELAAVLEYARSPQLEGLRRGTERAFADSISIGLQLSIEHLIKILPAQKGMVADMIFRDLAKAAKDYDAFRRSRSNVLVKRTIQYIGAPAPADDEAPVH